MRMLSSSIIHSLQQHATNNTRTITCKISIPVLSSRRHPSNLYSRSYSSLINHHHSNYQDHDRTTTPTTTITNLRSNKRLQYYHQYRRRHNRSKNSIVPTTGHGSRCVCVSSSSTFESTTTTHRHMTTPTRTFHQTAPIHDEPVNNNKNNDDNNIESSSSTPSSTTPSTSTSTSPPRTPNRNRKHNRSSTSYKFVDRARLRLTGGTGGRGCLSYEYQKGSAYKKKPDGGHGGNGGFIILVADENEQSLNMAVHHLRGEDGGNGMSKGKHGRKGEDVVLKVPCGVVVKRILGFDERWNRVEGVVEKVVVEGEEGGGRYGGGGLVGDRDGYGTSWERATSIANKGGDSNKSNGDTNVDENEDYDIDNDDDEPIDIFDDNSFSELDTESIKKKGGKRKGASKNTLPDDYQDVVDAGIRSEDDGQFHFSTPPTNHNPTYNTSYDFNFNSNDYDEDVDSNEPSSTIPSSDHNPNFLQRERITLADLDTPGSYIIIAAGGRGGVGNSAYAKRQFAPHILTTAARRSIGIPGENSHVELELKLIADVGLVGFPNAGKSSLLRAMSMAQPEIAPYPFTTLDPLVGCVEYKDGWRALVADVPGLIGGASEGKGRGFAFLKHLERTKALLYIVDAAGVDGRCPVQDMKILIQEISSYGDGDMMGRPALVVANKLDLIRDVDERNDILLELGIVAEEAGIKFDGEVLGISAGVTGEGLGLLSKEIRNVVDLGEANRLVSSQ